jgi:hypothetical protein
VIGFLRRLLGGRRSPEERSSDTEERLDAARRRLKQAIPPREEE